MKKTDYILIITALAASLPLILFPSKKTVDTVKITKNGELFCKKKLSENCEIDIDGKNTAVIENGSIYMKWADCPDNMCVHQGKITDSSKKIICLPNRVIIETTKKSNTDTVVR